MWMNSWHSSAVVSGHRSDPNEQINIRLRHFFDEREAHALAGKGRIHYLKLTQRVCEAAGIDPCLE